MPPVRPMLAKSVKGIPDPAKHGGLSFEPKWDGFRCLVFKDGDEVELASRNTKPLTRYFPEVVAAIASSCRSGACSTASSSWRIGETGWSSRRSRSASTPPSRRIDMLAEKTPAGFVAFDLLALGDTSYVDRPFVRAARGAGAGAGRAGRPCYLTRTTDDPAVAEEWFHQFEGAGLDGVVAKPLGRAYAAERPHHAQDQARAHRRRRGRGLPRAQDQRPPSGRCSAACCSASTPTASCSTSASAPASPRSAAPS